MNFVNTKRKIKVSLISMGSFLFKAFPKAFFPLNKVEKKSRHYVVFNISSFGSLGDSAMAYSIVTQIREKEPNAKITMFLHNNNDLAHLENLGVDCVSIEGYFSIIPRPSATRRMTRVIETATDYIIPGADVLDGVYSPGGAFRRLFSGLVAKEAGASVYVVGFSFSHRANNSIKKLFKEKLQSFNIVCRDPHSAKRLSEVMGREVPNGADLAFLLPIGEKCLSPAALIAESKVVEWKKQNIPVVAFNANPLSFLNAVPHVSRKEVVEVMAASLSKFIEKTSAALLFLTHDNRPAHSDALFLEEIIEEMDKSFIHYFVPETVEPTDIKRLCSYCDMIVTGRMHLGIAGLGTGTATMITDYQGKVTGLYQLFNTPELTLDLAEVVKPDRLAELMMDTFEDRQKYEILIQENLPKVKELSRKNLAALWE